MSFYWQQALQQQQQQNTGRQEPQFQNQQQQQQPAQGQWDYINLGGAPAQTYQWNQSNYHNVQQPPQPQQQPQQNVNGNQWSQPQAQVEHTPMLQQPQQQQRSSKEATPESQYYQQHYAPPSNFSAPPSKEATPEVNYSYQQGASWQQVPSEPTPQVNYVQPQQQVVHSHEATPESYYAPPSSNFQAPISKESTPQPSYYQPPSSKETTPAPQPINIPQEVNYAPPVKETRAQQLSYAPPVHQSREVTPEVNHAPVQTFEAPPVIDTKTVVNHPPKLFSPPLQEKPLTVQSQQTSVPETKVTPSSSEDDWEKADMEIQAVEDEPANGQIVNTEENSRESSLGGSWSNEQTPQVDESSRQITPDTKNVLNFTTSPGEAQATSTPKEQEKRGSISSQRTLEPEVSEVESANAANREFESGNNSDSTLASNQPGLERGSIRASYRSYKQTYSDILKRLNGYQSDKYRPDFRPSSKLKNPLLAAAGLTGPTRNNIMRNDGRTSVPLPQSQSFNGDAYSETGSHRRHRISRLDDGRSSVRQPSTYRDYAPSNQSSSNQHDLRRYQGRYSVMGIPYRDNYNNFPARQYAPEYLEGSSLSESEDEEGSGASDYEIRAYNMDRQQHQGSSSFHSQQHLRETPIGDGPELYYFGVVHIAPDTVKRIMKHQPPPPEYYRLPPMEKAAYMFYLAVYKQQYRDINEFHTRFNREYYKHICEGDNADTALYRVCQSIQNQYIARQQEIQKQAAYEASQRQLLSDETSQDGQSENVSLFGTDELNTAAARSFYIGPTKFSAPHAFLTFGVGGRTISVQPDKSISVVHMDDVKTYLNDTETLRVHDMLHSFKGPLIPNQSPAHTVRLFISKQIEAIKRSDVAMENRYANDVVESLLVWQLLEMMVKQQGNVTGPDIAELLLSASNFKVDTQVAPQTPDIPAALSQFTSCLLGGHVDEAVECAIRHGLFADALVLTRRLYPNDPQKILQIEERFLNTRSMNNPVNTLVSVANGIIPPVITDPLLDDWRTHAAIILANLNQKETAMNTIYQLARSLRDRDYHSAADFCFMVVCILAGIDPFVPVKETNGEGYFANISLVHSAIPDDDGFNLDLNQIGFLITDLQATEIFDYALRLKPERGESPLTRCVEYQTFRMTYAKLLATHGLTTEAYRYCVEIARSVWNYYTTFKMVDLVEMCDLAESLHYVASADSTEIGWINQLRSMCQNLLHPTPIEPIREEIPVVPQIKTEPVEEVPEIEPPRARTPEPPIEEKNLVDWNTAPIIPDHKPEPEIIEQHMTPRTHHQPPPAPPTPQPFKEEYHHQQEEVPQWPQEPQQHVEEVQLPPIQAPHVEPEVFAPPPTMPSAIPPTVAPSAPTGLRAVRGASRYANVGGSAPKAAPSMALPTSFGFMPQPQDSDDAFDPFSGQANPTIQQNPARLPADE